MCKTQQLTVPEPDATVCYKVLLQYCSIALLKWREWERRGAGTPSPNLLGEMDFKWAVVRGHCFCEG